MLSASHPTGYFGDGDQGYNCKKTKSGFLLPDAVIEYIKQNKLYETH